MTTSHPKPTRRYLWRPDVPDFRDQKFDLGYKATALPTKVDSLALLNRVEDQGNLGSCVGNAVTTALEIVTTSPTQLSRLFTYYNARVLEGTANSDSGCYIRDAIKGLSKWGASTETLWPYDVKKFARKPPIAAYINGLTIKPKISKYQRVTNLLQLKTSLASNLPVVFGFMATNYIETYECATTGILRFPISSDYVVGGHAVTAIGYDDATSMVLCRNSWGTSWGLNGNFKMPYQWFTSPLRLVDDLWAIYPKVTT